MFIYFLCRYYNHEWLNEDLQRLAHIKMWNLRKEEMF